MRCSENEFCQSLSAATRERLCQGCHKRYLKAGSLDVFENFVDKLFIVLRGCIVASTEDEALEKLPSYSFCAPGRLLNQNSLFELGGADSFAYVRYDFPADSVVAVFDRDFIVELYAQDRNFARMANKSAVMIMLDMSGYASIMRVSGMTKKIELALGFLIDHGIYLPGHTLADLLACNRTSVSRAIAQTRATRPELWERYQEMKHRMAVIQQG